MEPVQINCENGNNYIIAVQDYYVQKHDISPKSLRIFGYKTGFCLKNQE